jgi:hypothetical protein
MCNLRWLKTFACIVASKEETRFVNYLIIHHKVADFDSWKSGYDAHAAARQQAGLTEKYLLRSIQDRNEVLILYEIANLEAAKEFVNSSDLRVAMEKGGVLGHPKFYLLT